MRKNVTDNASAKGLLTEVPNLAYAQNERLRVDATLKREEAIKMSEQLGQEFLTDDFKARLKTGLLNNLSTKLKDRYQKIGRLEKKLSESLELELEFARRIIFHYCLWSDEKEPIVLWDVDETMGGFKEVAKKEIRWGFRPAFIQLIRLLKQKFPHINNGIVSTRNKEWLVEQLEDPDHLLPIRDYFDMDQIYSTDEVSAGFRDSGEESEVLSANLNRHITDDFIRKTKGDYISKSGVERWFNEGIPPSNAFGPHQTKKLFVLDTLKKQGLNVKSVDDHAVRDLVPDDWVCVHDVMPKYEFLD